MSELKPQKHVVVLGAGAMGSLFGGLLAEGGLRVTLLDPWQDHIWKIQQDGLQMVGFGGDPLSLGYFLGRDDWGRGYMTEALSAFLPELFDRFPMNRIVADHFADNPASGRVLQKMGFEKTGEEMGISKARLEPAPLITYAVTRDTFKVPV